MANPLEQFMASRESQKYIDPKLYRQLADLNASMGLDVSSFETGTKPLNLGSGKFALKGLPQGDLSIPQIDFVQEENIERSIKLLEKGGTPTQKKQAATLKRMLADQTIFDANTQKYLTGNFADNLEELVSSSVSPARKKDILELMLVNNKGALDEEGIKKVRKVILESKKLPLSEQRKIIRQELKKNVNTKSLGLGSLAGEQDKSGQVSFEKIDRETLRETMNRESLNRKDLESKFKKDYLDRTGKNPSPETVRKYVTSQTSAKAVDPLKMNKLAREAKSRKGMAKITKLKGGKLLPILLLASLVGGLGGEDA
tara:strand:- start:340 stop:1281 length:942 start_codon:yes stop_codon:yes gene_type:complete